MRFSRTIGFLAGLIAAPAFAQQAAPDDFSKAKTETHNLGNGVYVLETTGGSRTVGNMTFAVGKDAIILVDSGFKPLHNQLNNAIRAVSDKPIRYLVNTHHHPDHADGNIHFAEKGAIIVGHENMRKAMEAGSPASATRAAVPPAPALALPAVTYTDRLTLFVDGQSVQLRYPGYAHSGGDSVIYFPSANVLTTGDIYATGRYPRIDTGTGGSIGDMIKTVDTFIEFSNDNTTVVPGHGKFAKKSDVIAYRAMLVGVRDRVLKLKAEGKTLKQIMDEKLMTDYDKVWSPSDEVATVFLTAVYETAK